MLAGHLLRMGVRVPRRSLRESLLRVDPIHSFVRRLHTIQRRTSSVPNANSLWHIDGLHCVRVVDENKRIVLIKGK